MSFLLKPKVNDQVDVGGAVGTINEVFPLIVVTGVYYDFTPNASGEPWRMEYDPEEFVHKAKLDGNIWVVSHVQPLE